MSCMSVLPHLQHCTVCEIAEGVYIVQPKSQDGIAANAGIIALGDATIIFDTMLTVAAATELRQAAEELTNTPVKLIINSHHHADHVGGNSVFAPSTDIVSTVATRDLMAERLPQQVAWLQRNAEEQVAELKSTLDRLSGDTQAETLVKIAEYEQILAEAATTQIRLPNVTFEQKMQLYGPERQVEITTYGGGHTQSDTILHLPDDGIIFMGDLLTTQFHPYLSDGDPGELPRILDIITLLDPQMIVPGHGKLSTLADVQAMQSYLAMLTETALTELAFQYEDEAELEQKLAAFKVPAIYQAWRRPTYFTANLRFFYQRVMNAYAD